jgi:uncharacterized protein YciI
MPKHFAIQFEPGPAWIAGKPSREQPYWLDHAAFMNERFAEGVVIMGGPYADYTGVLVIVTAENESHLRTLFAGDPWAVNEVTRIGQVKEWLIFLDARQREKT